MTLSMEIPHIASQKCPLSLLDDKYNILEKVGSGCSGMVHRAIALESGSEVALKISHSNDPGVADAASREYELLKRLEPHPNIIKALDFHNLYGEATLVLEFFNGPTLQAAIKEKKRLPESTARALSASLCEAMAHLHANSILHRDVKPQNVLVSHDLCKLCLIDLNAAASLDNGMPLTPTGTELYKAPELLLGEFPCERSDVWASAMCIFFMLSGNLPQARDTLDPCASVKEIAARPTSFDARSWQHVSDECKAVLQRSLANNRDERPSMADVLDDSWFCDPIMRSLSLLSRVVPGAEAYLSVFSFAMNAQAT